MNKSHINISVPKISDTNLDVQNAVLNAQLDFWMRRASYLRDELANIPVALVEWGDATLSMIAE